MFEVYHLKEADLILFGLALIRISTMIAIMPIFGNRMIPNQVKILLSMAIAFVICPVLALNQTLPPNWQNDLILMIIHEAFVGIFLGFLTRLIFMSIEIAGQILSFTMGLSSAQLLNPTFNEPSSIMDQFETVLGTLLFLSINGHHMFLEALFQSFKLAPVGSLAMNVKALAASTAMVQEIFAVGVKLAGPMIAVTLFLNIALGIVGRAVPQINVFVISFPVNILVGLFVFMVSIPLLLTVMESDFLRMGEQIFTFIKGF